MKIIESNIKYIPQDYTLEGIYSQIEKAGRICYASESKENKTAKEFVDNLIVRKHFSPLEHGTIYLKIPAEYWTHSCYCINNIETEFVHPRYWFNHYSKSNVVNNYAYVTTNFRVLIENGFLTDLQYLCEPTKYHSLRYSFEVICSISVSREWNRHRTLSISEQSTRYCNFSKDKFDNEVSFIRPYWISEIQSNMTLHYGDTIGENQNEVMFKNSLLDSEIRYLTLINNNCKPQEAREVLPLCTATKVFYTGFKSDWEHWLELRNSNAAHPDIRKFTLYINKIIQ